MRHVDFSIGLEFWCGDKRWRCTDTGTRVIVAICLEPREMVRLEPNPPGKYIETRFISDDPKDLNGPPFGVTEVVFDEYDLEACTTKPETEARSL